MSMNYQFITVRDLIENIFSYSEVGVLYKKEAEVLNSDTKVLVSFDEYNTEDIQGYTWTLDCREIESIISNLSEQIPSPTLDQKIEAINYYIENDAFIDFGDK